MIKKFLFTLAIIFSLSFTNAQNKISGYVIDSLTNEPIEHVNITNIATKKVTYSGFNGLFEISAKKNGLYVLKFSHDNYKEKIIKIPSKAKKIEIFISQKDKNAQNFVKSSNNINTFKNYQANNLFIVNKNDFINTNYTNFDDFLKYSSIYVFKPFGIFTSNPVISINGTNKFSDFDDVFIEGIKLNNNDGTFNFNIFPAGFIKNIEISKSQLNSLFGTNSSLGILNIIPNLTNKEGFSGFGKFNFGNFGTYNLEISPEYKHYGESGIYFKLDAFAQKSNGYIQTPDSLKIQNIKYTNNAFREAKINFILGYDFSRNQKIELSTNYFQDHRISDIETNTNYFQDNRILYIEKNNTSGNFINTKNLLTQLRYSGYFKNTSIGMNLFAQYENKFKNIETIINKKYTLIQSNKTKQYAGANLYINQKFAEIYYLSSGINFQFAGTFVDTYYLPSTDYYSNADSVLKFNAYLQNSFNPFKNNKLIFLFGVNLNKSKIIAADNFLAKETTTTTTTTTTTITTNFMTSYPYTLAKYSVYNYNLNANLKYNVNKNLNLFSSFNKEMNNPTVNEKANYTFFAQGFLNANPFLKPQKTNKYSAGFNIENKNLSINSEISYIQASDFIQYLETGKTFFNGIYKIYQAQNITNVSIYNANLNLKYKLNNYEFFANYSYNNSIILDSDSFPNLIGKRLTFSPSHIIHTGIQFQRNNVKASLIGNYFSKQYTNDNNSEFIPSIFTVDANVSVYILSNLNLNFSIQNILNYQYIYYNQSSIGRFMELGIKYNF